MAACYLGVDVGSTTIKAVAVDSAGEIRAFEIAPADADYERQIALVTGKLRGVGPFAAAVATGYGQDLVPGGPRTLSEISCHARGIRHLAPVTELVIDIGGQDVKAIRVGAGGKPQRFEMNDKCAAGTGRFLEVMARALGVPIAELAALAGQSAGAARINSMCTVFAESEVITLLSRGRSRADVAQGLLDSIAGRICTLARRLGPAEHVALTGGVAHNTGVAAAVAKELRRQVHIPPEPQLVGALGAALAAMD